MKNYLCALVIFASALPGFAQLPTDEAGAAITKLREGLVASFKTGDIDGIITHLDKDVVVTWQNGEVCRGPEAVKAYHTRMMTGDKRIVREVLKFTLREIHGINFIAPQTADAVEKIKM